STLLRLCVPICQCPMLSCPPLKYSAAFSSFLAQLFGARRHLRSFPTRRSSDLKKQNHIAILKEIRKQDMITKTDLVDKVHLTSVGVGNIVGELIEAGIVREAGYGESRGGRPPVLYTMEWDSVYVIAV